MAIAVESADAIVAAFERHIFEDIETRLSSSVEAVVIAIAVKTADAGVSSVEFHFSHYFSASAMKRPIRIVVHQR